MKEWHSVFGTESIKPEEIDKKSSPTTVYQRRNIVQETIVDEEQNTSLTGWKREERELTLDEYSMLVLMKEMEKSIVDIQKDQIVDEYTLQLINEGVI